MKTIKLSLSVVCLFFTFNTYSQDTPTTIKQNKLNTTIGLGLGLDYGGIGANILYYPVDQIGLFGGVGYAFAGAGFNVGAKFRLNAKKESPKIGPYLIGMYGYNAAIAVKNASKFNKLFYGPTFGFGVDFKPKNKDRNGYWSLALLVPIRSSDVNQYIDDLKNKEGIEFENELLPIGFSIGYRIKID
ncbi:hypothetical protein [Flavobacterium luteum]|uniref:Outer membrane beta-barrel protein n=1 Tax=Flavobacterium luteum TaxID=2026654 RepID=A0A7J5ADG1_9FLAO|nr:hypothetical protein [Flavobacterium luteum]KAB1155585.1 hypothetical protein F6464_10750 [Flavobacterium luteum]